MLRDRQGYDIIFWIRLWAQFPLAAPPLATLELLLTLTTISALLPSTFELITFPSPVIVNPIVDPSASAVSPISNVNAFESPVAVIFKVMFSQFVPLVLSQLKSTVLLSPVNAHVPV